MKGKKYIIIAVVAVLAVALAMRTEQGRKILGFKA